MPDSLLQDILRLHTPDGAFAYAVGDPSTRDATLAGANEAVCTMLGYDLDELISLSPADIIDNFNELTGNGFGPFETRNDVVEHTLIRRDGARIPVEIRSHVLHLTGKDMNVVSVLDITRRLRSRQWEAQGQKCFRMLYELSKKFDEPEQAILDYALAKCLDMTGSAVGYIYFMNPDQTEMTLHAMSGVLRPDSATNDRPAKCKVSAAGLWGEAARQRQPIITNECPADTSPHDFPQMYVPIKRHLNLPIIDNGRIVLIAGMANKEEEYTETDVAYFSLPLDGVWRIIQRKRMEEDIVRAMTDAERGKQGQEPVPGEHEPRTPHAPQRHHGHDPAFAGNRSHQRTEGIPHPVHGSRAAPVKGNDFPARPLFHRKRRGHPDPRQFQPPGHPGVAHQAAGTPGGGQNPSSSCTRSDPTFPS